MVALEAFISSWLAAASCLAFAIIFVSSLFVFPIDDPAKKRAKQLQRLEREELQQHAQHTLEQQSQQPARQSQDHRDEDVFYATPNSNGYIPVPGNGALTDTPSATSSSSNQNRNSVSTLGGAGQRHSVHSPRIVSSSPSSSQLEAHFDHHSLSHSRHNQYHPHTIPPPQPRLDRDHPLVIKRRFKGIALTSVIVPFYLWFVFSLSGTIPSDQPFGARLARFLAFLGISLPGNLFKIFNHLILPLLLVMILFAGPLLMMFLSKELPFQQAFDWTAQRRYFLSLIALRNYVVGPLSEEFVFRACMVAIASISGATKSAMVFGLPMVFGVAHIHHAYESYTKNGRTRTALLNALAVSLFQLLYTTLFGWFATYCFLRTSNLIGPTLAHVFCNLMGFPDVTNIQYFGRWKYALYLTFVLGMVAFGLLLNPMTHPALYGDVGEAPYWPLTMGYLSPDGDVDSTGGDAAVKNKGLHKVVQSVKEAVKTAMTQHQKQ